MKTVKIVNCKYDLKYEIVEGDYLSRFDTAKKLIEKKLGLTTVW